MTTVIRDTSTGECFTTDFELDIERIEELGYEIAGPLNEKLNPEFTTCEYEGCNKWIMLSDEGGAPEFCTDHEEAENA